MFFFLETSINLRETRNLDVLSDKVVFPDRSFQTSFGKLSLHLRSINA